MKKQFSSKQFKNLLNRLITESLEKNYSKYQDDNYDDESIETHGKRFFSQEPGHFHKIKNHLDDIYLEKKEEMLNNGQSFIEFYNNLTERQIRLLSYESLNFNQDVKSAVDKLYKNFFFEKGSLFDIMKYDNIFKDNIDEMYKKYKYYLNNNNLSFKQWINSLNQYKSDYLAKICPDFKEERFINKNFKMK